MGESVNNNLDVLFNKMENYVSTKTVVGEPMKVEDTTLLPLIDVSFGVGAASANTAEKEGSKDAGGGGLGAKITPSAVIAINKGNVQLVNVKNQEGLSKLIDLIPVVLGKVEGMIKGTAPTKEEKKKTEEAAKRTAEVFAEDCKKDI